MGYSQKPLIKLLNAGKLPGETSIPKHIETVISHVFIFDDKVYKFYKNDNDFFNKNFRDISKKSDRINFTTKDFGWNQALSPSIHLELIGISVKNNAIETSVQKKDAEELVIVMNRVDTNDVLFEKLVVNQVSAQDSFEIGKQLAERLKKVQTKPATQHDYSEKFKGRVNDLREWMKSVTEYISEEESGKYCDYLENFLVKNSEWFKAELTSEVTADGDFHSQNALFSNGTLQLIDTFPPKDDWAVGHKHTPLYRVGTDIWGMSGKQELFESFISGFESESKSKIDRKLDGFLIIYAAGIAVSYLYMLQRTDLNKKEPAERFHKFMREYFSKLDKH